MMLAVTMRGALETQYGVDDYRRIRSALDKFAGAADATVVALDDHADMDQWNLPVAFGSDPGAILASLRTLRAKIGATTSTLLVGGNSTIPFWRMANPVDDRSIDPDEAVLSDNPYGTTTDEWDEYLAPPVPVGRLVQWDTASAQGSSQSDRVCHRQSRTSPDPQELNGSGQRGLANLQPIRCRIAPWTNRLASCSGLSDGSSRRPGYGPEVPLLQSARFFRPSRVEGI